MRLLFKIDPFEIQLLRGCHLTTAATLYMIPASYTAARISFRAFAGGG